MPSTTIIAEIGQNHNGDLGLAKELIHAAAESGATIAKFQLFDAKKLFSPINNPWYEYNLMTELSFESVIQLDAECKKVGIEFMASAFDLTRLGWLENLNVKFHKLASRSLFDKDLALGMLHTGKPCFISLGIWQEVEFPQWLISENTFFFHCISQYPAPLETLRLSKIDFNRFSGFSDHSIGTEATCVAISRGARYIEKHFTLDKNAYGPDHSGSMDPDDLRLIVNFAEKASLCL